MWHWIVQIGQWLLSLPGSTLAEFGGLVGAFIGAIIVALFFFDKDDLLFTFILALGFGIVFAAIGALLALLSFILVPGLIVALIGILPGFGIGWAVHRITITHRPET